MRDPCVRVSCGSLMYVCVTLSVVPAIPAHPPDMSFFFSASSPVSPSFRPCGSDRLSELVVRVTVARFGRGIRVSHPYVCSEASDVFACSVTT